MAVFVGKRPAEVREWPSRATPLHRYTAPVEVVLDYCSAGGGRIVRRVHITRSQYRRDGRIYLTAFCHHRRAPRTFRVDRVLCFATPDGEIIDTRQFLVGQLAIPPDLCGLRANR